MRTATKGMIVQVISGEHAGKKAEVLRGSTLDGSGRARLRLIRRKRKGPKSKGSKRQPEQLELFTKSLRSLRFVK